MITPVPINVAEAIIEPFWDPQLSGLSQWQIADGAAHGLRVSQFWCYVNYEWARRPAAGPALRMTTSCTVQCQGYDRLVVSLTTPAQTVLRLVVETDRGPRGLATPPLPGPRKEVALDLDGATEIRQLTIELCPETADAGAGWFNWIGLQASDLLPRLAHQWEGVDAQWPQHLQPETHAPQFKPAHGLLFSADELAQLQQRHAAFLAAHGTSPFTTAAAAARAQAPETLIREFVNFWGEHIFSRERDQGVRLDTHSLNAALAGMLLRDPALLRLGARYALALARCGSWETNMGCHFPGGAFEQRCFSQATIAYELAVVLDVAHDLFTPVGRDVLLRRLAEEALGSINFNTWKFDYIFHCNQLAWFSTGRMAAYALLEKYWPRVRPYTEIAYRELLESLDLTILPDGGYVEGPTYFRCVGRDAGLSLYLYARARGREFTAVIPEAMRRTGAFGAAVASTDDAADVIPICDAHADLEHDVLAVMSAALPDSAWVTMFRKAIARTGGLPNSILACQLEPSIPAIGPALPSLVQLPDMGLLASVRPLGPEVVKLLLMGNHAGAGHTHQDKGSFVLEFAGDTFAMDPGICNYGIPLVWALKGCERHNMLVPVGTPEQARPQSPLMSDVKPVGDGDAVRFHATMQLAAGWEPYYRRWTRRWEAPTPDRLVIRDEYELAAGTGVEFYWQTRLPVVVQGRQIVIEGRRGVVTIEAPADRTVRVDELPLETGIQRRIAIGQKGASGTLEVQVSLRLR